MPKGQRQWKRGRVGRNPRDPEGFSLLRRNIDSKVKRRLEAARIVDEVLKRGRAIRKERGGELDTHEMERLLGNPQNLFQQWWGAETEDERRAIIEGAALKLFKGRRD